MRAMKAFDVFLLEKSNAVFSKRGAFPLENFVIEFLDLLQLQSDQRGSSARQPSQLHGRT